MSTVTTSTAAQEAGDRRAAAVTPVMGGRPGIPMGRLVRVELRKLVDTRTGRWMLIAIGLVTAGAIALVMAFSEDRAGLTFGNFLAATSTPQLMLLPVLGILTATAEFSQRTGLVTWTQEPRRLRVVLAKLVAASVVAVAAYALAVGLAALATVLAEWLRDGPGTVEWHWGVIGGGLLTSWLGVVQGVAFGLLIVVPGAAIAAFFIAPVVLAIITATVSALKDVAPWIDPSIPGVPLLAGRLTGTDWAHLGTSYGLWVALPLAVGSWLLTRREIK